ncbi:YeeE/YedE family protein [Donghicola mangrovi]|uniref:YeeE/YedE family protein n=1 Tax=Donghicola mangrovi TaxID=2729614 RepID=A0A850Q9P6_9RHOB|nr:YeeE/YedE family protein [Donghicola mangrovi]NVO23520.1 YeeE/YedE family protein [Donghicola mangrovi]
MFEQLGLGDVTPREASIWLALAIGVVFGLLAEPTRFCFRRAVAGPAGERRSAAGLWLWALGIAVLGTQGAVLSGLISFDGHRFTTTALPVLAIILGGLAFGTGMVLTRGCITRLTVLTATGNLRALTVMLVFAVTAHAAMKGVLAPARTALSGLTNDLGIGTLADLPGGALVWSLVIAVPALAYALTSRLHPLTLIAGAVLGLLVPAAWVGTGYVLLDEFDPIALESLAFTAPVADSLFYVIASTAVEPTFGAGLVGGVLAGALVASLIGRRFEWQGFEAPAQMGRYITGGVLMGFGGVLAGGCTIGAGLAGVPTLGLSAILALLSIAAGGVIAACLLDRVSAPDSGFSGSSDTQSLQPAE